MDRDLLRRALTRFFGGVILLGLLLFLPAGTLRYGRAWLLMAVLFIPMLGAGLVMLFKAPDLLRKRLNMKEEQGEQKTVILLSGLMFTAAFVAAGLSFRFGFLQLPLWLSCAAAVAFLLGYLLFAEVLRENAYLSRTIEVQEGQRVVDTGLYGVVRHPMYAATIVLFLAMPLILGSLISFFIMLFYLPVIQKRIRNEEAVLASGLKGYEEYRKKVRYKVIPFLW